GISASSTSITGIPSRTGYRRPHLVHMILSPSSLTGALSKGHARILRSSASTNSTPHYVYQVSHVSQVFQVSNTLTPTKSWRLGRPGRPGRHGRRYSTVTLLARFLGWSISFPLSRATWYANS